ncbi:MAG: type II secretion system F family protein [Kyrpidia sp.]|nr:type II secretion system F family protein [Kyrpidia sp.]
MALFRYQALDRAGKNVRGQIEAPDSAAAAAELRRRQLFPVRMESTSADRGGRKRPAGFGTRIKLQDIAVFCRQFSTLVRAGVPAARSLEVLAEQTENRKLQQALENVHQEVRQGTSLRQGFAEHTKIFPPLFVNMVGAGEASGQLDLMLDRAATFYERERATSQKIISALTYPMVVLFIAFGISIFLLTSVVPTFAETFTQQGVQLPLPTRITLAVSWFLVHRWFVVLALAAVLAVALAAANRTPAGRRVRGQLALLLPVFGKLNKKNAVARFARTFSTLSTAGVPVLEALELTKKVIGNALYEEALTEAQDGLRSGQPLAAALARYPKLFPPIAVQMTAIGEETGNLDELLNKLADFYETDVQEMSARLGSMLEPLMILFLSVVVGVIILSVYMPMFQMMNFVR